jgi:hypothetical protein
MIPCGSWMSFRKWAMSAGPHADLLEVEHGPLLEETHDDPLAVAHRQRGDADVDLAAGHARADAAVLRNAFLGDVELRHDLHARDDRGLEPRRRLHDLVEHAVDPEPDAQLLLERLDVDVARRGP